MFDFFALEDIVNMLNIKIIVFSFNPHRGFYQYNLFKTNAKNAKFNNIIFIKLDTSAKIKYNWLMHNQYKDHIKLILDAPFKQYFLSLDSTLYFHKMFVLSYSSIERCFGVNKSETICLFLEFLRESPVHTFITLIDLNLNEMLFKYLIRPKCIQNKAANRYK